MFAILSRLHCRPFVVILNRENFRHVQRVFVTVDRFKLMKGREPPGHDHADQPRNVGVVRVAVARYGVSELGFTGEPESLSTSGPKKPRFSLIASMRSLKRVVTSRM